MGPAVVLSPALVMGVILFYCSRNASPKTNAIFGTLFGIAIAGTTLGGIGLLFNKGITDFAGQGVQSVNQQLNGGSGGAPSAPAPAAAQPQTAPAGAVGATGAAGAAAAGAAAGAAGNR